MRKPPETGTYVQSTRRLQRSHKWHKPKAKLVDARTERCCSPIQLTAARQAFDSVSRRCEPRKCPAKKTRIRRTTDALMMEQMALAPPLPPKTRRSPPGPTVLAESAADYDYQREIQPQSHVVKIRINPSDCRRVPGISINVNPDMIQKGSMDAETERNPYFYFANYNCNIISSGQVSPSDTLDSGTCSDLDGTPPPLPKKKNSSISVTVISAQHKRAPSLTSSGADADSDDNESSISYDSLNGAESLTEASAMTVHGHLQSNGVLPQGLLQDIRQRNVKLTEVEIREKTPLPTQELACEELKEDQKIPESNSSVIGGFKYDADCYYSFHLNENVEEKQEQPDVEEKDETFAGYKDILGDDGASTIRSAKGTVRGVKNRVRAGIATFLQINSSTKVSMLLTLLVFFVVCRHFEPFTLNSATLNERQGQMCPKRPLL